MKTSECSFCHQPASAHCITCENQARPFYLFCQAHDQLVHQRKKDHQRKSCLHCSMCPLEPQYICTECYREGEVYCAQHYELAHRKINHVVVRITDIFPQVLDAVPEPMVIDCMLFLLSAA